MKAALPYPDPEELIRMSAKKATQKDGGSSGRKAAKQGGSGRSRGSSARFTEDERAAMKDRAKELEAEARTRGTSDGEADVLAKIAEMPEPDQVMARRLHALVTDSAPELAAKTWYGMPAYAREGKVVCFFQSAQKFKSRYATLGFSDSANLDDGVMWPTSFALKEWTPAEEKRIRALIRKAVS